jgi:MFS family permease
MGNQKFSITALSVTNMVLRMFLQALIPVYPFLIGEMSKGSNAVGVFLSLSYVFLFVGTYLTGIIVPRYCNSKITLLLSTLPILIALACYGIIHHLVLFDICGCVLSLFVGVHICSNNITMGYYSSGASVSKNFGLLTTGSLLATVTGGLIVGPLLAWLGYRTSFLVFSMSLAIFFILLFPIEKPNINQDIKKKERFEISRNLSKLLIFNFLISILLYGFKLIISVMLKKRGWNVRDISIMMAVGTACALPVTLWWSTISNYKNSRLLLIICTMLGLLAYASLIWIGNYWVGLAGFACISVVAYTIVIPLMSILFKWYDHRLLPRAQALLSSSTWLSAIVGFLFNGYALERFNENSCISVGIGISLLALTQLLFIPLSKLSTSRKFY